MSDVNATIESYLGRLDSALREVHEREREELLAEVRAHLQEAAVRAADPEKGVADAVRSLGDPRALARRLREPGDEERPARERVKRVLGMPFNFGPLSAEEIARRVWNPSDPRLFMPRVFGIGWTVNFGAVAVRLGLVRPDDEEPVPFSRVPGRALWTAFALLTAMNLATLAAALVFRRPPRPVPVHWGFVEPDGFATPFAAAAWLLGPALVLNAVAAWRFLRHTSPTERTLWVGMLSCLLVIMDGLYLDALYWALTGTVLVFAGGPVLAGLVAGFVVFVAFSRLGVRAEWRDARVR